MKTGAKLTGGEAMIGKLRRARAKSPTEFGRAMYQETEVETRESKRRTPVDTGTLRDSEHTEGPVYSGMSGRTITTAVVAGGAAAGYAVPVHENMEANHPVGQAKYIESTLMESAPFIAARIARRIDLNRVIS